jgi:hypothetical protein
MQIEVRESLLSFGAEFFVFQFCIQNLKIKIYRTIKFCLFYGCETWSLTLREENRLCVFENMVLRRIFGPKRDEGTGEWRKLHIDELNDLYCSPTIVRVIKSRCMRWAGHVARIGREEMQTVFRCGKLRERDHLENLDVDERMILKWFFKWGSMD